MDWIHRIAWGDAPTWCAATFAAVAAWAAWRTMRSQQAQIKEQRRFIAEQSTNLALERQQMLAAAQERREEQARQIWFGLKGSDYVRVSNESRAPITDVRCEVDGVAALRATTVLAGDSVAASLVGDALLGAEQAHLAKLGVNVTGWFQVNPSGGASEIKVSFTDAAGNRWTRLNSGDLEQIQP